ncbi:hypothetical protein ENBRE01_0777 [Enteropsectra breve]|nr:hypothetical protein ENBRE01_0777 [Enteropsectra breve]
MMESKEAKNRKIFEKICSDLSISIDLDAFTLEEVYYILTDLYELGSKDFQDEIMSKFESYEKAIKRNGMAITLPQTTEERKAALFYYLDEAGKFQLNVSQKRIPPGTIDNYKADEIVSFEADLRQEYYNAAELKNGGIYITRKDGSDRNSSAVPSDNIKSSLSFGQPDTKECSPTEPVDAARALNIQTETDKEHISLDVTSTDMQASGVEEIKNNESSTVSHSIVPECNAKADKEEANTKELPENKNCEKQPDDEDSDGKPSKALRILFQMQDKETRKILQAEAEAAFQAEIDRKIDMALRRLEKEGGSLSTKLATDSFGFPNDFVSEKQFLVMDSDSLLRDRRFIDVREVASSTDTCDSTQSIEEFESEQSNCKENEERRFALTDFTTQQHSDEEVEEMINLPAHQVAEKLYQKKTNRKSNANDKKQKQDKENR